jgi:hypothetical protein
MTRADANDQELVAAMACELRDKAQTTMDISFRPMTVFQLTGLLQLALRHPAISPELHDVGDLFIDVTYKPFGVLARVEDLRPIAAALAKATKTPITLAYFSTRHDVEVIKP